MGRRLCRVGLAILVFMVAGAVATLHAQLNSGSYAVGDAPGADYTSIDEALAAISTGINGPVVFRLQTGVHTPSPSGYVLTEQSGMNAVNTVTFRPDDGATVVITGSVSSGAIFRINGGDNYIIDGSNVAGGTSRDLTILNTATDYASAVILENGADSNLVRNSVLQSASYTWSPSYGAIVGFGSGGNDYNSINACTIGDPAGVVRANCGVYSFGTGISEMNIGDSIIGCDVVNFGTSDSDYNRVYGISVGPYNNGMVITGNRIHMTSRPFYNYVVGVNVDESNGNSIDTRVEKNRIHSLLANLDLYGDGYVYDLYYNGASAVATTFRFNNNMVSFHHDGNVNGYAIALEMSGASNTSTVDFHHNTVSVGGFATGYNTYPLYITNYNDAGSGQTTFNHRNNLYDLNRSGMPYGWYLDHVPLANWNSDYNLVNFTSDGGNFVYQHSDNPLENNVLASFGEYQSATGRDLSSLSGSVLFVDPSAGDLHLSGGCDLFRGESRGTPVVSVGNDIDDIVRSATNPDIGADEGSFNGDGIRVVAPVLNDAATSNYDLTVDFTTTRPLDVAIEISTDDGLSWQSVGSVNPTTVGTNRTTIKTPGIETATAQIRVVSADNICEADTSNTFRIVHPTVEILNPNGGEVLVAGDAGTIGWRSQYLPAGLHLDLQFSSDGGGSWSNLATDLVSANMPSINTVDWTVPNAPTVDGLIRLVVMGRTEADTSNARFTILAAPVLAVVSPNGGQEWFIGERDTIRWSSTTSDNINIDYSTDGGVNWMPIASRVPAFLGRLPWTIPNTPSESTLVRITDNLRTRISDLSDGFFKIVRSDIRVVSPNGGEKYDLNQPVTVSWTSENIATLRLEYSTNNGGSWLTVAPSIPATLGSWSFIPGPMPTKLAAVRLVDAAHPQKMDRSDAPFEVQPEKAITLYMPSTGGQVMRGSTTPIIWDAPRVERVNILFSSNGGGSWQTVVSNLDAAQGSHTWSVPNASTTQAKIRIQEVDGSIVSESGLFEIIEPLRPTLALARPNGGENYMAGQEVPILWSASGVSSAELYYSSNSGADWTLITGSTNAGLGIYKWRAPNVPGARYRVRIVAETQSAGDTSDADFTILSPAVPMLVLLQPNGGEALAVDSLTTIRWNATDLAGDVNLLLSTDAGGTWQKFATVPARLSLYNWSVPDMPGNMAMVRVEAADRSVADNSDAFFQIVRRIASPITLLSPNGGETWRAGEIDTIRWTAPETVASVNIDLSIDGGANWLSIQTDVASSGGIQNNYIWNVPNLPNNTNTALVRVRDAAVPANYDLSDRVFRITNATGGVDIVAGAGLALAGNYPNPFASTTEVRWMQSVGASATLRIFTQSGDVVGLYDLGYRNAGDQRYVLEARDLPSGGYIYELRVGASVQRHPMLLVR